MAELNIKPTEAAHATLDTHKLFAYWLLVAMAALTGWRMTTGGRLPERARLLYSALCLIGVGLLVGASHQGGKMVYDHGAGVRAVDMLALDNHLERVEKEYRHWDRNPSMQDPMTGDPSPADQHP